MKICIDMRPALSESTGVGVYLQNLTAALSRIDSQNEYHLFSSSWKQRFSSEGYGKNFHIHDLRLPVSVLNYCWHRWSFPSIEFLTGAALDVVHSPTPLLIPARRAHRVTTVHDLYFYFHPEHTAREIRRDYGALVQEHCRKSDAIIAISDYTKQQLVEKLGVPASRVYTIRHGADPFFQQRISQEEADAVLRKFGIAPPYFLFVGASEPRKNPGPLMNAFASLEEDCRLVVAGPKSIEDFSNKPNVVATGYITRAELRALYQAAVALVMPSLDEGFGLPVLEAMAAGTPVIASAIPALEEVGGDAFYRINPNNIEEIREAFRILLRDSALRRSLIEKGWLRQQKFSWDETARKTLELYQNL